VEVTSLLLPIPHRPADRLTDRLTDCLPA